MNISQEEKIHQFLTSGKIESIKLFQVNESYFDLTEKQHWIIDCGIELKLTHGYLSIAWDTFDESIHFIKSLSMKYIRLII